MKNLVVILSAVWDGKIGRRWKLTLALASLVLLLPAASARSWKIGKDLDTTKDRAVDVIVQYNVVPSASHQEKAARKGGRLKRNLREGRADVYSVPATALDDLADDPDVKYISPNREVKANDTHTNEASGAATAQRYGWSGWGIGVAVIDSGVSLSNDLIQQVVYSESFVAESADERYGHGTHVAGIIAGSGRDSYRKYVGVAPGVKIVNLRVLNDQGVGTDSDVIAAIDRAIELRTKYNIRVINLSLGRAAQESYTLDPLCQAVERAWKAGIVVVAAAGNYGRHEPTNGYATIGSPGIDPYIITVGAMKSMSTIGRGDDQIASYSSKGPTLIDHFVKPDLVAPGNTVISVDTKGQSILEKEFPKNKVGTSYFTLSGTSMAAPVVSGAAALLLQRTPYLTPNQVKARLMKTAYKQFPASSSAFDPATGKTFTSYYDIFTVGAGYVDIAAALASMDLVRTPVTTPLSPQAVYDTATGKVKMVGGSSLVWGDSLVWGASLVWGDSLVWGNKTMEGFSLVWGNSMVWGAATTNFSVGGGE